MTTQQLETIAPLASPLPPPLEGDVLTEAQWTTLMAIGDAVIPAIEASSESSADTLALQPPDCIRITGTLPETLLTRADKTLLHEYLAERPSSMLGTKEHLHRTLSQYLKADARKGISLILSTLE